MKSIIAEASSIAKAIESAWIRAEKPQEFSVKIFEEPEKNLFGMVTKSAKIALVFKNVEKKQSKEMGSKHKVVESPMFDTQSKEYRKEQPRREPRETREHREPREPREPREHREHRETREPREFREPREQREPRETRELRETREPREFREPREQREPREMREPREQREQREPREMREPRNRQEFRDQESQRPKNREHRELISKEPVVRKISMDEQDQLSLVSKEATSGEATRNAPEKIFWNEDMIATTRTWMETLLKDMNCSDITFNLEPKRYYLTINFDKQVRQTKGLEQQFFRSCAYLIMQMLRTRMKKQFRGLKVVLSSPAMSN